MQRTPVSSTAIQSVGYDPAGLLLEIEFTTGKVYQYRGVPPATYAGLMHKLTRDILQRPDQAAPSGTEGVGPKALLRGAIAPVPRISTKSGPFSPGEWLESLPGSARGY